MNRRAQVLCIALLTTTAGPVAAEVRPSDLVRPANAASYGPGYGRRVTSYQLEIGAFSGSAGDEDRFAVVPLIRVTQPVRSDEVELIWGFSGFSRSGPAAENPEQSVDQSSVRLANPYLCYQWVWRELPYQIRVGAGLTAPLATLRTEKSADTLVDLEALAITQAMHGMQEFFLWTPETISQVIHVDAYMRHHFGLVWGGQANLANQYGFNDDYGNGYQFAAEVDLELAFELEWARFAVRGIYFTAPTSDADDTDQISVEPDLRFRLGAVDLFVRYTLPIDEPFGFGLDDGKVWGAHIGVSTPTERHLPAAPKAK